MGFKIADLQDDDLSDDSTDEENIPSNNDVTLNLFKHYSNFFGSGYYEPLMKAIKKKVESRANGYSTNNRKSCIFSLQKINKWSDNESYAYPDLPPIIEEIMKGVEAETGETYDYVLAHIYYDGLGSIGYHSDSEAINSSVASVSFGATRKFRLRKIGRKSGWDHEFRLKTGDLFMMYKGCQSAFMHSVPVEATVKRPRINLTFRHYE